MGGVKAAQYGGSYKMVKILMVTENGKYLQNYAYDSVKAARKQIASYKRNDKKFHNATTKYEIVME